MGSGSIYVTASKESRRRR